MTEYDPVKQPQHYDAKRFGCECIEFARYMTFPAGNAFKYVWRHWDKSKPIEDLRKAQVYADWAWKDWVQHETRSVLPGFEAHIQILRAKYLCGPFSNPVYYTLESIVDSDWLDVHNTLIRAIEVLEDEDR